MHSSRALCVGLVVAVAPVLVVAFAGDGGAPSRRDAATATGDVIRFGIGAEGRLKGARVASGHPTIGDVEDMLLGGPIPRGGAPSPTEAPDDPPDSPLTGGAFVNYESPAIEPLALSTDGARLFAVNTPNNSLVVIDAVAAAAGGAGAILDEIPVGMDPVAAAVRPGTGGNEVWVSNRLSDNVSVVNIAQGRVVRVMQVGDEPGVILFTEDGATAFVVCEGPALAQPGDAIAEGSGLVAINAGNRTVIGSLALDLNAARSAVYDADANRVIVASLLSGNNTTVAGAIIAFTVPADPDDPGGATTSLTAPSLFVAQVFSLTAPVFAAGGESGLGAYPDPSGVAGAPSPLTMRIVPDRGAPAANAWQEVIDILEDDANPGQVDPATLAAFEQEFPTVLNAEEALEAVIDDVKDIRDNDVQIIDVSDPGAMTSVRTIGGVGTTLTAMALNERTGEIALANMQAKNGVRLEPAIRGVFIDHELVTVRNPHGHTPVVSRVDLNAAVPGFDDVSQFNQAAHDLAISNPIDIVFTGAGEHTLVAALGSDRLAAVSTLTGVVVGRVDVGRGPRGVAHDDVRRRAFVFNRTDHTISVVDTANAAAMSVIATLPLFNPEPADVRDGRDFLYSTRFSNNNRTSCGSCHIDARLDGLAWDLGDHTKTTLNETPHIPENLFSNPCEQGNGANHPVKGPMVTQSLQGLEGHEPLHWRGDRPLFEDFNPAFDGLLGGSELAAEDMQKFRNFVMSINYPPNPHRTRANEFKDPLAIPGRALIVNACNRCHEVRHDGALNVTDECPDVPGDSAFNLAGLFAQVQLVPQLRDLRKKANFDRYTGVGLLHDGRDEREDNDTVTDNFLETFFGFGPVLQKQGSAFLLAWQTNTMPVVGFQSLASGAAVQQPPPPAQPDQGAASSGPIQPSPQADLAAINLMIHQHALTPSRCDVIAKGVVGGQDRGYWMTAAAPVPVFRSSHGQTHTLGQLLDLLGPGDSIAFTAVPPGSGRRIGIDQDDDCLSDGIDPAPQSKQKDPDLTDDGVVNSADLAFLLGLWGTPTEHADLDDSGSVGAGDMAMLLGGWGTCP